MEHQQQPENPQEERDEQSLAQPFAPPHHNKKITVLILALVIVAGIAVTVSQHFGGPLPTWDEIYEEMGFTEPQTTHEDDLAVHFIDVGQGDCIFVQTPTGDSLLIDAGENGNEEKVISYLAQYGDDTLEYVVATHPHSDHIGALDGVLGAYTVQNILMPRLTESNTPTNSSYKNFLKAVKASKAKVIAAKAGYTFSLGKGTCTVLSPARQSDDLNNMSVVLRLDWGNTSFLFTGDAESAVEKELLNGDYAQYLDASVLKLGHHGSNTSSTMSFLNAVSPAYSVISCGAGNDYGHPHRETMEKLSKLDTTILRTDTMGSIRMYSDGETIHVETDNG